MKYLFPVLLCWFAVGLTLPAAAEDGIDKELIGEWEIVEMVFRGKVQDFGGRFPGKMKFERDRYFRADGNDKYEFGNAIVVRPDKKPREIDIRASDQLKGIYEITGDEMKLIYPELEDFERPTVFDAVKDKRYTYYLLKRIK